jgi:hypothetical protein
MDPRTVPVTVVVAELEVVSVIFEPLMLGMSASDDVLVNVSVLPTRFAVTP